MVLLPCCLPLAACRKSSNSRLIWSSVWLLPSSPRTRLRAAAVWHAGSAMEVEILFGPNHSHVVQHPTYILAAVTLLRFSPNATSSALSHKLSSPNEEFRWIPPR